MPREYRLCRQQLHRGFETPPPNHLLPAWVRVNSGFTSTVPKADLDEKFL